VVRANEEMGNQLGRQPTVQELADRLGVETNDILESMEYGAVRTPISIDTTVARNEGGEGRLLAETVGDEDEDLDRVEMRDVLQRAMAHLSEREQRILAMRFIDEMSQAEVAKRLGISQMHVSRLQRAATEQLREQMAAEAQEVLE